MTNSSVEQSEVHTLEIGWRLTVVLILLVLVAYAVALQALDKEPSIEQCYYYYPEWTDEEEYYEGLEYTQRME